MSACVQFASTIAGTVVRQSNISDCASQPNTYVLLTPAEVSTLSQSPLNLSVSDGLLVSGAIFSVWAVAWGFKALAKTLASDGEALD